MDPKSRWLTTFLLVVNTILIVFIANMFLNLRAEVRGLKDVLVTKSDLQAVRTAEAKFLFAEEKCTRCHTERRFSDVHGTKDELLQIVRHMQEHPDARITEQETDKIHASLMLLKCTQCHSGEMMKKLSLMSAEQRLGVIREMAKKPGTSIATEEAEAILKSYELLLGF